MDDYGLERKVFRVAGDAREAPRERLRIGHPIRQRGFPQPADRRAPALPPPARTPPRPVGDAVTAYDRGSRIAVRRMPAGYRTSPSSSTPDSQPLIVTSRPAPVIDTVKPAIH